MSSLLMEYQISALGFDATLVTHVDMLYSTIIVNTEYYTDCQVQLNSK